MLYAFCQWPSQMCASVGRSLDNDNNNTIGLFSAFHGPQRRFREQTCKVVVVENHVTHRLSSSFHSTLTKTPSSPIAPAEKNVWRRHWLHTAVPVVVSLFMKVYRVLSTYQIITIEKDSPKPSLVLCSTLNITYHFPEKFEALFIQVSETSILPSAPHSETHEKQTKSQPEMIHYTLPHSPNVVLLALDLFSSAFRYSAIEHILGPIYGVSRYLPAFHWRYRSSNMSHLSENES